MSTHSRAVINAIVLHVAKSGGESGQTFATAIEYGMKGPLKAKGVELSEVTVPLIARMSPGRPANAGTEILRKAFEKFKERGLRRKIGRRTLLHLRMRRGLKKSRESRRRKRTRTVVLDRLGIGAS